MCCFDLNYASMDAKLCEIIGNIMPCSAAKGILVNFRKTNNSDLIFLDQSVDGETTVEIVYNGLYSFLRTI